MSDSEHQVIFRAPIVEEVESLFPAYNVHALIACGGMGAVYQATQKSLDRVVAIKILPREFSTDEAFRTGFEAEAKAMAKLNHPNLIGVYDFGEVSGMLYIIMEYVAGKSLFHSANAVALDPDEASRIVADVCRGLAHAHEFGILHRDIKPSNILLDPQASPKIGDFGLARALESQIEEGEQIFGTPGYTAPEVVEPPFTIDHRADIFSVGVMLHELLVGKLPSADTRPPSQICGCSPRFDEIVKKATNPDPNQRYSSANDFAKALENPKAGLQRPMLATGGKSGKGTAYTAKKHRQSSSSGLGVLVLFLVVAAVGVWYLTSQTQKRRDAPEVVVEEKSDEVAMREIDLAAESGAPAIATKDINPLIGESRGLADAFPDPATLQNAQPSSSPDENAGLNNSETPATAENEPALAEKAAEVAKPEQKAASEPKPTQKVEPEPELEPEVAKFDVDPFLDTQRQAVRTRMREKIAEHDKEIEKNTKAFGRKLSRAIRRNGGMNRDQMETMLEEEEEEWEENGFRIPRALPELFSLYRSISREHVEFYTNQTELDRSLQSTTAAESKKYITNLEKKIGNLESQDDPVAAQQLRDEIRTINRDKKYFSNQIIQR